MRLTIAFAGALAACLLAGGSGARAQAGINQPWCGVSGSAEECVYQTLEQCEYEMRPISGDCAPNPRLGSAAPAPRVRADRERPATSGAAPGIDAPWCGRTAGTDECVFRTQAECEYEMRPNGGICFPNPDKR
jgi:hypothetical protein